MHCILLSAKPAGNAHELHTTLTAAIFFVNITFFPVNQLPIAYSLDRQLFDRDADGDGGVVESVNRS